MELADLLPEHAKKYPTGHCEGCRKPFYKTRKWQTFCSDKCRVAHFRAQKEDSLRRDAEARLTLERRVEQLERENLDLRAQLERLQ